MVGRAVPSNTLQGTLAGQGCGLTRLLHSKSTVGAPWSQHWLWLNVTFPPTLAWEISSLLCQCWRGRWRAEPFIAEPRAICGDLVPWTSIMSPLWQTGSKREIIRGTFIMVHTWGQTAVHHVLCALQVDRRRATTHTTKHWNAEMPATYGLKKNRCVLTCFPMQHFFQRVWLDCAMVCVLYYLLFWRERFYWRL